MGKLVTVKSGFSGVLLPDSKGSGGWRNYATGAQVTVTDAEYAALPAGTLAAITLTTSGLADPYRAPAAEAQATGSTISDNSNSNVSGAATAQVGWNDWVLTGNVTSVSVAANSNQGQQVVGHNIVLQNPTVGATPGSAYTVAFKLTQDGTGSRTVTWGSKFKFAGGTAPVLTTAAGSVDIVKFVTLDGGNTFYNTDVILNVH